jgi:hypothetical protein
MRAVFGFIFFLRPLRSDLCALCVNSSLLLTLPSKKQMRNRHQQHRPNRSRRQRK